MAKKCDKHETVLVGTYRPENEAWIRKRRLYNLPLPKCGKLAFHGSVSGIVLFAEGHPNFAFKAKFKDVVDGAWLKKNGYSLAAKPHGEQYALYELIEESTPAKLLGRKTAEVFVSSSRCPCVKIDEAFYSKPYPVTGGKSMPYVFDCLKPYFRKWKSAMTFDPVQEASVMMSTAEMCTAACIRGDEFIKSRILAVRGVQVLLDRDLAMLYGVETKVLNQAVKRNIARFPDGFMFQLSHDEMANWKSQFVTSNLSDEDEAGLKMGLRRPPYAFTEQGVAMLSAVLRSATAIEVSVRIMRVFVAMRKALASVAPILSRLDVVERRQITDQSRNEERFDAIFKAMGEGDFPSQKVFYNGRHYEAYSFAKKLVRKATKSIVLVDGYCDDVTLDILANKRGGANVTIATVAKTGITPTAVAKFNKQNPTLTIKTMGVFHDRFLILDGAELYHFGASLKDLGRQYCAVSKMDAMFIPSIMGRI